MLSISQTLSFSFCKRTIILGSALLFFLILGCFGLIEFTIFMTEQNVKPTLSLFTKISTIILILQTLLYTFLFSYLSIRAKSDVYNLPNRFSSEFFTRIFVTFFLFQALIIILGFLLRPYIQSYVFNFVAPKIIANPHSQGTIIFLNLILPIIGFILIQGYIISMLYMSYIMNFNFNRFFFKIIQCIKRPLIFLQIVIWGILFLIITFLPILGLYIVLKTFSAHDFVMSFANCILGRQSSTALWLFILFIGGPVAVICIKTSAGKLMTVLFSLLYLLILGLGWCLIKQMGIPTEMISIPTSALLYLFFFFFIFCLMFVLTSIALPTGYIHLLVQGAFHVHKTFNPTIEKPDPTEPELPPQKDDGWL